MAPRLSMDESTLSRYLTSMGCPRTLNFLKRTEWSTESMRMTLTGLIAIAFRSNAPSHYSLTDWWKRRWS